MREVEEEKDAMHGLQDKETRNGRAIRPRVDKGNILNE